MMDENSISIFDAVAQRIPSRLALAGKLLAKYRDSSVHELTVENVMHGLRGTPCLLWEISETNAMGIKHHGKTIPELMELLPKWPGSNQMSPEAMLWFLYTAQIPTLSQLQHFSADLISRAQLPLDAQTFCDSLSTDIPPDTQLIMTLSYLARFSKFTSAVTKSVNKTDLWKYALEDALDITARFPMIVARITANSRGISHPPAWLPTSDLAQNYVRHIGREGDSDFVEFTRLCWSLFMDHGTSVSSHAMRLCSSAWTDPYLTIASGLIAGTGPLHAKAIADSVMFNLNMISALGPNPSRDEIISHLGLLLSDRKIIPGYGHALLRVPDARLTFLERFLDTHPSANPKVQSFLSMIQNINGIVPDLLRERVPGMKNPHPNADALSGCILYAYGVQADLMLSYFACSRAMGFSVQQVWDRALGVSMERPLSLTMDELLLKVESRGVNAVANGSVNGNGVVNGVNGHGANGVPSTNGANGVHGTNGSVVDGVNGVNGNGTVHV